MSRHTLLSLLFLLTINCFGQLHPSIGIGALPNDNDSVCPIPVYTGSFNTSGYQEGDTVADFTLYKPNGDSVNLAAELQSGTPVLLVTGNYTCPVFRGKINDINTMASVYGSLLKIFVVYVVEAHPINDVSPYSGTVWVPSANYTDDVLFEQPDTYGQRKEIIDSLLAHYTINVPILIDGPCNNWWLNYGPSPNNAYLINTNGVVVDKNPWYNRPPDNMFCSIDSLLGMNSGYCVINGNNGTFTFSLDADSMVYGVPSTTLSVHTTITNNSATDNVEMDIVKRQINTPPAWQTALCADICYAPTVDSIRITLAPSQVQPFIFYFYTDANPDSGSVRVVFRNVNNTNNRYFQKFYGFSTQVGIQDQFEDASVLSIYPNPAAGELRIKNAESGIKKIEIYNTVGRNVLSAFAPSLSSGIKSLEDEFLNISSLPPGIYFITLTDKTNKKITRKFVKM